MAQKIKMVAGDVFTIPVHITANKLPEPLTGCTVDFIIKSSSGVVTNTGHTTVTITDITNGYGTYTLQASDTPTADSYFCDVKVTFPVAAPRTAYNQVVLQARAHN